MFDGLIGNEKLKAKLAKITGSGDFPRSTILAGNIGVGKKHFALEIARAALCTNSDGIAPCEKCSPCTRSLQFSLPKTDKKEDFVQVFFSGHPDLGIVIPNKQTIYIDAIRDLNREANFRPYEAGARFFIIDEAEKMTTEASNALLKTLEEPVETSHLFLITSKPASLLPTVRSRCQTFRFMPIAKREIERFLIETKNIASEDAKLLANISGGSLSIALGFDLDVFRTRRAAMYEVLENLNPNGSFSVLLRSAEELTSSKARDDFENYISILRLLIGDIWKIRNGAGERIANTDLKSNLVKFADEVSNREMTGWFQEIEKLESDLRFNLNRKIAADALFLEMRRT